MDVIFATHPLVHVLFKACMVGSDHYVSIRSFIYGQTANEDPRKSEFESKKILNLEGGLS